MRFNTVYGSLQDVRVLIPALVNDTVGTLASSRYDDGPDNNICIIIGTGGGRALAQPVSFRLGLVWVSPVYMGGVHNFRCTDGAGTNCCYVEQLSAISKWVPRFRPRTSDMVVNIGVMRQMCMYKLALLIRCNQSNSDYSQCVLNRGGGSLRI